MRVDIAPTVLRVIYAQWQDLPPRAASVQALESRLRALRESVTEEERLNAWRKLSRAPVIRRGAYRGAWPAERRAVAA